MTDIAGLAISVYIAGLAMAAFHSGSYSQTVPVASQLTLAPPLKEVQKKVNESLIVTCQSPDNVNEIYWKSPINEKITTNKGRIHVESTPRGLALIFDSIERNDKGNYTCNAVAGETKMRTAFNLVTIKPITFRKTPDIQNATENEHFIVQCEADGDPVPNIFWFINGTTAPFDPKQKPMAKGLYISNVTLEDRGMYQCRAMQMTTNYADMLSKTIQLKVFHKPKWKSPNQTNQELAYGYLSGVVNLTCEAIADPEPQFTWRRNNIVIQPEHHNATVINEPHRSILQLPVHNQSAFGEYKCEANNSIGRVERIIILQEGVKPNPPKEISVRDTTVHTADMEITSGDHEDGIIGYRFQFVIKQPGIQHTWDAPDYQDFLKDTGSVSKSSIFTVIDLLENTEYAVRVASRNAAGLSDFTNELRFRTKSSSTSDVTSINQFNYSYILFTMLYLTSLIE